MKNIKNIFKNKFISIDRKALFSSTNKSNLLILSLVGVVIISSIILTSFSAFSSIDNGKNGISVVAKVPDRIAPTCGSIVGESSTWTNNNRQISITCNDNRECEKGVYITTFDSTTKTASITIKDKVGNSVTCPVSVYVDKTAPTCGTITGASTTWTKDNRTVSITCSDNDSTCSKTSFSNTFSTTVASNGVGYITISDVAGNTSSCPVNAYVDKTGPTCGIVTGASTTWTNSNRTISVACSDANSKCSKASFSNTYSTTTQTANITLSDNVGNTTACPVNVYVDKTPPTCGAITGASTTWTNSNRTISVACSDANSKCTKTSFSNTFSTTAKTSNIAITDNAGNSTNCPVNVYVDKTPPVCGAVTNGSTTWSYPDRTISVACSDTDSQCTKTSFSKTYTTTTQTDNITISDVAGNTKSCPVNVYIDKSSNLASNWKDYTEDENNFLALYTLNTKTLPSTYTYNGTSYSKSSSVDVSEQRNSQVLLGTYTSGSNKIAVIGQDGGVVAPANSNELFGGATTTKYTTIDLSNFNTSKVTDMHDMFARCSSLTSIDVSKFDTSKVTNMTGMFFYCLELTNIDITKFNTASLLEMKGMFQKCSSLTSINMQGINTSKVTNMSYMFYGCSNLTGLNLTSFSTNNATKMNFMFCGCSSLTSLDLSSFDTRNTLSMNDMFVNCSALTALKLGTNFSPTKATTVRSMFNGCSALTSLDLSHFNTSNVTDMGWMFQKCSSLTSLNLGSFNTSNVTDMGSMFQNCNKLISITVGCNWNTSKVTNNSYMFSNCGTSSVTKVC